VIAKFAFIVTPYPLILSMEIHCGSDQQIKMAKIFRDTLGDDLLLDHLDGCGEGKLPSPEDLKYKILLKVLPFISLSDNRSKILLMRKTFLQTLEPTRLIPAPNRIRPSWTTNDPAVPVVNPPLANLPKLSANLQKWQYTQKRINGVALNTRIASYSITSLAFPSQRSRNF